jgi:hypothetical protein
MRGMRIAMMTVLSDFHTFGMVFLFLGQVVISPVATLTRQRDLDPHLKDLSAFDQNGPDASGAGRKTRFPKRLRH